MHQSDADIFDRLSVARLPSVPQVLAQLIAHCQADEFDATALAQLIARDPGMAAKILAAAGVPGRSVSLGQSLASLDPGLVKTLMIAESVRQTFDLPAAGTKDLLRLWRDGLTAAFAAQALAEKIGYSGIEESYIAGLLHNVGRLALPAAGSLDEDAQNAEAGATLIASWDLDSFLADSVRYQHGPAARLEHAHPLLRIVFVARLLAGQQNEDAAELEDAASLLGIDARELASIRKSAVEQLGKTAADLEIDLAAIDDMPPPDASGLPAAGQDAAGKKLAGHVRNLALFSETGNWFARQGDPDALLAAASGLARLLLDFRGAAFLMLNQQERILTGFPGNGSCQRLAQFSVPLASGGALATAALQGRATFTARNGHGIHEDQLLRMLGGDELICVPLVAHDRCLGVLAGTAATPQTGAWQDSEQLLDAFGVQVATALHVLRGRRAEAERHTALAAEAYRAASQQIVHEANNPLAIIRSYLSVLDRKLAKQEPVGAEISILMEEIDRVSQIIGGLTEVQPAAPDGAAEINRIIHDVARLFRDMEYAPSAVRVAVLASDEPAAIDGDANTVKQILVNLLKNAVEAMPNGGEIEIRNNGIVNQNGVQYLGMRIRDTGPGIPKELMANLFSPVRSTKGDGHKGLGLTIVHGLVKGMHGRITCHSSKQGTEFEILLPVPGSGRSQADDQALRRRR